MKDRGDFEPLNLSNEFELREKAPRGLNTGLKVVIGGGTAATVYLATIPAATAYIPGFSLAGIGSFITAGTVGTTAAIVIGTLAVSTLPAAIFGGLFAYKVYKDTKRRNTEEQELEKQLREKIHLIEESNKLQAIDASIVQVYGYWLALHAKIGNVNLTKEEEAIYRDSYQVLRSSIENMRKVTGNSNYGEGVYKELVQFYKGEYKPQSFPTVMSADKTTSFIAEIAQRRKERGLGAAAWLFTKKAANRLFSFLGGAGIALTIAGVAFAFTGFGLPVALTLFGIAVAVGVATSVVENYTSRRQEQRIKALKNNAEVLSHLENNANQLTIQQTQLERMIGPQAISDQKREQELTELRQKNAQLQQELITNQKLIKELEQKLQNKERHSVQSLEHPHESTAKIALKIARGDHQEARHELENPILSQQEDANSPQSEMNEDTVKREEREPNISEKPDEDDEEGESPHIKPS